MDTKKFKNFEWEEEVQILEMPYFYFRKHSFPICVGLNCNFMLYIFSLFHSGPWQSCITYSFDLRAVICEIFCLKS